MKQLSLFTTTFQKVIHQPAIILLIVVECALLLILLFAVQCEYDNGMLVSIHVFGKSHDMDLTAILLLDTLIKFLWNVIMFLLVLGTAGLFAEFFTDPLLSIYITKGFPRYHLVLSYYLSVVFTIAILQGVFALAMSITLYLKTGSYFGYFFISVLLSSLAIVSLLVSVSSLVSVFFEKPTVSLVVVLVVYFVQPLLSFGYDRASTAVNIFLLLLPPISQVNNAFFKTLQSESSIQFPIIVFLYIFFVLSCTLFYFQKKDIV
ncbi:MAG: hypothetical protein N3A63_07320 [Bacteroidetes bacterium]|nr:hypothetical protein [Bacteroidota bacterium]